MTAVAEKPGIESADTSPKPDTGVIIVPTAHILPEDIDRILADGDTFRLQYQNFPMVTSKYTLAYFLIQDGRYPETDAKLLLKHFLPTKEVVDRITKPEHKKQYEETIGQKQKLYDSLELLMLQKGIIKPFSPEAEAAEEQVERRIEDDEYLKELIAGGLPIGVMGHIMTLQLFSGHLTDEQKFAEWRSWTTKASYRSYLGVISGETPVRDDFTPYDILARMRGIIHKDPSKIGKNLILHYFEELFMKRCTDMGPHNGIADMEAYLKRTDISSQDRMFVDQIYFRFLDILTETPKGDFKKRIMVKGKEREFPSFEQSAFLYDVLHNDCRFLAAQTGLGKTNSGYLVMENMDVTKALIIAPASGKETWVNEENVVFNNPGNTFVINTLEDLDSAMITDKKYIIIGQEFLGRHAKNEEVMVRILAAVVGSEDAPVCDGSIIDEIANLSNANANVTAAVVRITEGIRGNYERKHGKEKNAPIIGLSAAPIKVDLTSMNAPMAILYPEEYALTPNDGSGRQIFSDRYLNRPDLVYMALIGERKMFRWEKATGIQEFEYKNHLFEVSAFEEYLYSFIVNNVPTTALNKIGLLEDALLNPKLVIGKIRELAHEKIQKVDIDDVLKTLRHTMLAWMDQRNIDAPVDPDDYLSSDRLVELGHGEMVLQCFLSSGLDYGIDEIVEEMTKDTADPVLQKLRAFWKPMGLSSTYQQLRKDMEDALTWRKGEDGVERRKKMFVVSPTKKKAITRDVEQKSVVVDGVEMDLYSDHELDKLSDETLEKLINSWTGEETLIIDGDVAIGSKRNSVIHRFTNVPEDPLLLATLKSVYLSRDYMVVVTKDSQGREIDGTVCVLLIPTWYYEQLRQFGGRELRHGQVIPAWFRVYAAQGLIGEAKADVVRYTHFLDQMSMSGNILSPDDRNFFDSVRTGEKIAYQSPDARFMGDVLSFVSGLGEEKVEAFLEGNSVIKKLKTRAELFAERFAKDGLDEYQTTGYVAELAAFLIKKFHRSDSTILSVGAGTLLLQRKLQRGIDNVDMNPHMMEAGMQYAGQYGGRTFVAKASSLDPEVFLDNAYDVFECGYTLHWTSLYPEKGKGIEDSQRVKSLLQSARTLRRGGDFILTLPEKALDDKRFYNFTKALEDHFGFTVDKDLSGRSFGVSKSNARKTLGWCIRATKTGDVHLKGLNLEHISFYYDSRDWVSEVKKKKNKAYDGRSHPDPALRMKFEEYEITHPDVSIKPSIITMHDEQMSPLEDLPDEAFESEDVHVSAERAPMTVDDLRGADRDEFRSFRTELIKPLTRILGINWEAAEKFCEEVLKNFEESGKIPGSKIVAFAAILREAKKKAREGNVYYAK